MKPKNPRMISSALGRLGQHAGLMNIRSRATVLGISYNHLANIERGESLPTPEVRERMAKAYKTDVVNVETAALYDREGYVHRITEHVSQISGQTIPDGVASDSQEETEP